MADSNLDGPLIGFAGILTLRLRRSEAASTLVIRKGLRISEPLRKAAVESNIGRFIHNLLIRRQPMMTHIGMMRALHRHKPNRHLHRAGNALRSTGSFDGRLTLRLALRAASLFGLCRYIPRTWQDRFCGPVALAV